MLPATQVDHRISKGEWKRRFGTLEGVDDDSNLQAINADCHEAKTAREALAARGLSGEAKPAKACAANGLPVDPRHPWNQPVGGGENFQPTAGRTDRKSVV